MSDHPSTDDIREARDLLLSQGVPEPIMMWLSMKVAKRAGWVDQSGAPLYEGVTVVDGLVRVVTGMEGRS